MRSKVKLAVRQLQMTFTAGVLHALSNRIATNP